MNQHAIIIFRPRGPGAVLYGAPYQWQVFGSTDQPCVAIQAKNVSFTIPGFVSFEPVLQSDPERPQRPAHINSSEVLAVTQPDDPDRAIGFISVK